MLNENSVTQVVSFVSFDESQTVDFQGDFKIIDYGNLPEISTEDLTSESQILPESEAEYIEKIDSVIEFIKTNRLKKLVISRRKKIEFSKSDLSATFQNLCKSYPNAFAYIFQKNEIFWMGAFSEVLGKFDKKTSTFETMSLAGTLALNENWSKKEIDEQKTVTDYISGILNKYSKDETISKSDTYDHISGNIKHLRTDFKTKINQDNLDNLIQELHPTPAVCGIPKDFCQKAISDFEKFPREFYAGYIKIENEETVQYFVNLRCAKFYKNAAEIFVGGGITAGSSAEKEWQETELKAEAILRNLVTF